MQNGRLPRARPRLARRAASRGRFRCPADRLQRGPARPAQGPEWPEVEQFGTGAGDAAEGRVEPIIGDGAVEDVATGGIGRERRQYDPIGPGEEAANGDALGPEHRVEMARYGPFADDRPMAMRDRPAVHRAARGLAPGSGRGE